MEKKEIGYAVVNFCHPSSGNQVIHFNSFAGYRRDAIANFIKGTNQTWEHWRDKWGFKCVKVENIIRVINHNQNI